MKTPIADFVSEYARTGGTRLHMPGHKDVSLLGCESLDITEIKGADDLFSPEGIVAESERNATALFGTGQTLYSTEGATLPIKAMLALAVQNAPKTGGRPRVLAARNAHKSFVYGCGLLDIDVTWLFPQKAAHLCSCPVSADEVDVALSAADSPLCAVFLTSPDYLGQIQDIAGISAVCKRHGVPLLVDNAHGAYLAFSEPVCHPIALGATMCADSAHKTLPVLTGGAYLHIAKDAPGCFFEGAREAMALFASTSPSYLILQSLDLCNAYLADRFPTELSACAKEVAACKAALAQSGFTLWGEEALKITLSAEKKGYTGTEIAKTLRDAGIEPEFADNDLAVLMYTPQNTAADRARLLSALSALEDRTPLAKSDTVMPSIPEKIYSIRTALLSPAETVDLQNAIGRICATPSVSCPPAVPIVMSGERVTKQHVLLCQRYGIDALRVIKE
ncbi:MAG: amino acid decarboxylase [Clostridia bacterium]|nr:amino acid decarboxylase [Clostridia bacterium]